MSHPRLVCACYALKKNLPSSDELGVIFLPSKLHIEALNTCSFAGTTNLRGTWKSDNPIEGIWNPIPQNPDNPFKGIWDLVPNIIQSQWSRGLIIPTYVYMNSLNQPLNPTCQFCLSNYIYLFNRLDELSHGTKLAADPTKSSRHYGGGNKKRQGSPCGFPDTHISKYL